MNLEIIQKYLPSALISMLLSYSIIKIFNKSNRNKFEKPYDYFKYYVVDTSKDYLKMFLIFPVIFIIVNYIYNLYIRKESYNIINITTEIIKEIYLMIVKIAKGYKKIE